MDTVPLHLTAPFENRRLAGSLVTRVTGLPVIAAHSLVLTTDAASTAVLRTAGIPTEDARPILAALWWHPTHPADQKPIRPRSPNGDKAGERQFIRDLGQRIHVIRHARRLTRTASATAPASRPTCCATSKQATCHPPPCSCTGSPAYSPCPYPCWSTPRSPRCGSCGCCPATPPESCHRRRQRHTVPQRLVLCFGHAAVPWASGRTCVRRRLRRRARSDDHRP